MAKRSNVIDSPSQETKRMITNLPDGTTAEWWIQVVPLDLIRVDRAYQREPSQRLIDKIAADYNPIAADLILVADRGPRPEESAVQGGWFLVNGQHRSLAARKRGETEVWGRMVDFSKVEEPGVVEAQLRLKTNVGLSDRPQERFKAQLAARDPDSLAIQAILASFDTEINIVPNAESGINCVSQVEALYLTDPTGALLRRTMEITKQSFENLSGRAVAAASLKALAWFIESHDIEADWNHFLPRLRMMGTEAWYRQAISTKAAIGGSTWFNYYRYLIELYNQGLSKKAKLEIKTRGSGSFASRGRVGSVDAEGSFRRGDERRRMTSLGE